MPRRRRRRSRSRPGRPTRPRLIIAAWLCLALILGVWLSLGYADDWLAATMISYGPRWVWMIPPLLLSPMIFWQPWVALPLAAAVLVAVGPIMQYEIPLGGGGRGSGSTLTVITFNAAGNPIPPEQFRELAADADVVGVQECDRKVHESLVTILKWRVEVQGGLCVSSRHPMTSPQMLDRAAFGGGRSALVARVDVATKAGALTVFNVDLDGLREGIESAARSMAHQRGITDVKEGLAQMTSQDVVSGVRGSLLFRVAASRAVADWVRERQQDQPTIVLGSFNFPTDGAAYADSWASWGNAFEEAGAGFGYTKWYPWFRARLDHVLYKGGWRVVSSRVGPDLGSDHRPVIATLELMR